MRIGASGLYKETTTSGKVKRVQMRVMGYWMQLGANGGTRSLQGCWGRCGMLPRDLEWPLHDYLMRMLILASWIKSARKVCVNYRPGPPGKLRDFQFASRLTRVKTDPPRTTTLSSCSPPSKHKMSILRPFRATDMFKFNNMCGPPSPDHISH